jgi:hypothetical protein
MLRPARYSDHTTLAALCSAAFFEEDLFGRVMHPRRHEFPDDVALYWLQHIRNLWFDWRNRAFVAVSRDEKTGQEKIVGLAVWQRQGEGGKKMALSSVDPREYSLRPRSLICHKVEAYRKRPALSLIVTRLLPLPLY